MTNSEGNDKESVRNTFLLRMYDQMFNDINRHISVVWQPITVLVGSFALLAAGMRDILSIDLAVALIILLVGWLIANLYDSAYWYNRNLVIIANIERQFLKQSDLRHIHYYFGKHRSKHSIMTHIRIQWWLGIFIGGLVLLYHFFSEVLKVSPYFFSPAEDFHLTLILPHIVAVVMFLWLLWLRRHRTKSYDEFLKNSPGIEIDTTGIDYGAGHPIERGAQTPEKSNSDNTKNRQS